MLYSSYQPSTFLSPCTGPVLSPLSTNCLFLCFFPPSGFVHLFLKNPYVAQNQIQSKAHCELDPNPSTTISDHMTLSTLSNFSGFIFSYKKMTKHVFTTWNLVKNGVCFTKSIWHTVTAQNCICGCCHCP